MMKRNRSEMNMDKINNNKHQKTNKKAAKENMHRMNIKETEAIEFGEEMWEEEKERLKRSVLKQMRKDLNHKKKYNWKPWKAATAAAVAAIVVVPSGVFAAGKIAQYFHSEVNQDGYRLNMEIAKESNEKGIEDTKDSIEKSKDAQTDEMIKDAQAKEKVTASSQGQPVKLVYNLPKSYKLTDEKGKSGENGWFSFNYEKGFDAGKDFACELLLVDQSVDDFFLDNVGTTEKIDVNGNKGVYIKRNNIVGSQYADEEEAASYNQRVMVFYEEEGYILQFYAMGGIDKETLLQYVSDITIESCEEKEADQSYSLAKYVSNLKGQVVTEPVEVGAEHISAQNQTVSFDGIEYQVNKVQVLDSISSVSKNNGKGFLGDNWSNRLKYADENGKLKTYTRETLEMGDGYTKPYAAVVDTKEVAQKFVMVEFRVKNTTKEKQDIMVCKDMEYLTEKDGIYKKDVTEYARPKEIEECQDSMAGYFRETDGGTHCLFKELQPGQEEVYHIGYFVDEDYLDNMFLAVGGEEGSKIDIRQ